MIVREREPLNLEMPFGSLDEFLTPVDRFFVRGHFAIPQIDMKTWRLRIEGEVEEPLELTYDWMTRIIASAQPFNGYYQTIDYAYWQRGPSAPTLIPITAMQVKALIARPGFADTVRAGEPYDVRGAAWTSEAEITKVEISTDGGETWHDTRLLGEPIRNAWRLWAYDWTAPTKPGKVTLMARATDSEGRTQPTERDQDRRNYIVNHLLPIEVDVR
jgi:DMSO/TMAO reductase YedYZ molybdopterin-dependent catalytic subunit